MPDIDIAIMPASDIKFALRLPVDLDVALRARAEEECQSLNTAIVEILRKGLSGGTGPVRTARTATTQKPSVTADAGIGLKGNGSTVPTQPVKVPELATKFMKASVDITDEARLKMVPGEKCVICGAGVYEVAAKDSSGKKWKCVGPRTHTMSPREPKETK
jgi:hypothetical protein